MEVQDQSVVFSSSTVSVDNIISERHSIHVYLEYSRLCCECGTPIIPNPATMCVACLRSRVDITEGVAKQCVLYFCKGCERSHTEHFISTIPDGGINSIVILEIPILSVWLFS
jgi:hypothetical protein